MIDEVGFLVYNSRMERDRTQTVYTERNAPKRAIVRSDGALYLLLLLFVFGTIALSHVLAKQFGIDRLYVQLGLYSVLLIVGYVIYRLRLVDYLYELTERELIVTQAVGSKQKRLAAVPFDAIEEIGAYRETDAKPAPCTDVLPSMMNIRIIPYSVWVIGAPTRPRRMNGAGLFAA